MTDCQIKHNNNNKQQPVFVKWGGDPYLHAKAQVAAWKETIHFFRKHLGPVEMYRQDWTNDDDDCDGV